MPSLKLHRKIRGELMRNSIITEDLDSVDRIIDIYYRHDVGRKSPPEFKQMLGLLWLHFGDIIIGGEYYKLNDPKQRNEWYYFHAYRDDIVLCLPDDVVATALIHHVLDMFENQILNELKGLENPSELLDTLDEIHKHLRSCIEGINRSKPYYTSYLSTSKSFETNLNRILSWIIDELKDRASELYREILEDAKKRKRVYIVNIGDTKVPISHEVAQSLVFDVLSNMNMYQGVLRVNGQLLPPPAAVRKIAWFLLKGDEVIIEKNGKVLIIKNLEELLKLVLDHSKSSGCQH